MADGETITIRMYRNILGDCFLLTHLRGGKRRRILIDCGILQGVKGGAETMRAVAADIAETTRSGEGAGSVIDLLVLTHEHADHLSGFAHGRDFFFGPDLEVRELWLAWTENAADPQAKALRERFAKGRTAMHFAARLAASGLAADGRVATIDALDRFNRFDEEEALAAAPALMGAAGTREPRLTGARVIDKLKEKAGPARTRYLEPGEIVHVARNDAESLKAYVLGPPRDEARLAKDRPSGGAAKEVYLTSYQEALAVESAARAHLGDAADPSPFAPPYQRPVESARGAAGAGGVEQLYFDPKRHAATIDKDWIDAAESLALKMDSDTNNSSLALAFELGDGQVLLFPGDAQVGNWLSWGDQTYPRQPSPGETAVTVDDILRRVTFYKVGHHASHNATLRAGLERMGQGLTAMIPVVEAVAKAQPSGWDMPYPDLYAALKTRTEGRILRGDGDMAQEEKAFAEAPVALRHHPDGLWVEIDIAAR